MSLVFLFVLRTVACCRRIFMKDFKREDLSFSLCGLNCGLCPMNLNQYCPGCGGGEGNQTCSIAKCSLRHGKVEYCFQCENYPCEMYDKVDEFDSFITHQHQKRDMEKFRELGTEVYSAEQQRKKVLLNHLSNTYSDGHKSTPGNAHFFSISGSLPAIQTPQSHCAIVVFLTDFLQFSYPYYTVF